MEENDGGSAAALAGFFQMEGGAGVVCTTFPGCFGCAACFGAVCPACFEPLESVAVPLGPADPGYGVQEREVNALRYEAKVGNK